MIKAALKKCQVHRRKTKTAVAGFFPFNTDIFKDSDFVPSYVTDGSFTEEVKFAEEIDINPLYYGT